MAGAGGDEGVTGHEALGAWAPPGADGTTVHPAPPPASPPAWPPAGGGPAPAPGGPQQAPRQPRTGLVIAVIAGAVVVLSAAAFLLASVLAEDGAGEAGFAHADPADAVTVPVPDDYEQARSGEARVSLPPTWTWSRLSDDLGGVGDRLAPDDPGLARDLEDRLSAVPRFAVLIAYDGEDLDPRQFNNNVVLLDLPGAAPEGAEATRAGVAAEMESLDARVAEVSYVDSAAGPALRVRYSMRQQGMEVQFLQYWYVAEGGLYSLAFSSDDLDDHVEVADAMASSFDIVPPPDIGATAGA